MAYIIADIGSNYSTLEDCKKLIKEARKAGAKACKFQSYRQDSLYAPNSGVNITDKELPYEWLPILQQVALENSIDFLCSVFSLEAAQIVNQYVAKHKIASSEVTNKPLVELIMSYNKYVFVSIGQISPFRQNQQEHYLSYLQVIQYLAQFQKHHQVTYLHCVQNYPTNYNETNFSNFRFLKTVFCSYGFSDHTTNVDKLPYMGVALGCEVFEKHFKGSYSKTSPDAPHSLNCSQMTTYVKNIIDAEEIMFNPRTDNVIHRTVQATKDLKKGDIMTSKNIAALRAGKQKPGSSCWFIDDFYGREINRDIIAGDGITYVDIKI